MKVTRLLALYSGHTKPLEIFQVIITLRGGIHSGISVRMEGLNQCETRQ
jgi:hypothetical protein